MADNLPNEQATNTVVVVQQAPSAAIGICALIFSIISIFFLALVFVPLAFILAVVAIIKKQYVWGICAIVIAFFSACLSPTIWGLFIGI